METSRWKLQMGRGIFDLHGETPPPEKPDTSTLLYSHQHNAYQWHFLVRGVVWCYQCNWTRIKSFPEREGLNWDESLLHAAAPTNHITAARRRPDRLYPFQEILPSQPPSFLWTLSQLICPAEATVPCQHFKRAQILINHPPVAPKPRQAGWKSQTNKTLMSGLDCLRSCNATLRANRVIEYWKVNIALHWGYKETLESREWSWSGGGANLLLSVMGKKAIQLQAVRNASLSSQSWSGESYFEDLSVD